MNYPIAVISPRVTWCLFLPRPYLKALKTGYSLSLPISSVPFRLSHVTNYATLVCTLSRDYLDRMKRIRNRIKFQNWSNKRSKNQLIVTSFQFCDKFELDLGAQMIQPPNPTSSITCCSHSIFDHSIDFPSLCKV